MECKHLINRVGLYRNDNNESTGFKKPISLTPPPFFSDRSWCVRLKVKTAFLHKREHFFHGAFLDLLFCLIKVSSFPYLYIAVIWKFADFYNCYTRYGFSLRALMAWLLFHYTIDSPPWKIARALCNNPVKK